MSHISKTIRERLLSVHIRYRLMLYLLVGLIPIILTSLYFSREVYQLRRHDVLLSRMAIADATAGAVREFMQGIVQAHQIMSLTINRQGTTYPEMTAYFQAARERLPMLDTLAFALPSGTVTAGYPQDIIGGNVSDRSYFRQIASGKSSAVSQLLVIRPTGELGFVIADRVERNGRLLGVLFSSVSPETLRRFVSSRVDPSVTYGILDSGGQIIVSTVLSEHLIARDRDRSWIPSVREALRGHPAFAEPFVDRADGVRRMGASVPVSGSGWVVNAFEPVSTAFGPVQRAADAELAVLILITIALLGLIRIAGGRLARPINALANKANAVAAGDFSQRLEPPDHAELGALADAFNNMTQELERISAEQTEARERALFLADIGELLVSSLDSDTVLSTVTEKTVDFLGYTATVFELQPDGKLEILALHSRDREASRQLRELTSARPLKIGSGIVGTAVQRNHTVFIPKLSEVEDPEKRYYLEKLDVVSSIAVPIRVHGEIVGALSVSSVGTAMNAEDVKIVEELARRLGLALENIRLYEEALEREEFQASMAELAREAGATLDANSVLKALCSRALDLFEADGAYIWVRRKEGRGLYGSSACGFNADGFVGSEVPLTEANAAAVKATMSAKGFYLHDVPSTTNTLPELSGKFHTQSAMFQPIISAGVPLGVIVITDIRDPNRFDEQTLQQLELLAGYVAPALANARAYERERSIAETLQNSLLAEVPAAIHNFELAYYYAPVRGEASIGGDFYDYIRIRQGVYALVVGDVSGKGLEAAVVTAMAKYVIRAYTAEDPRPESVTTRTNDAIFKYTPPDQFITLVYCLLDTSRGIVTYASAGHEPVIIWRNQERKIEYKGPTGMALGVGENSQYAEVSFALTPSDMMIMYTDGLTDSRPPGGEFLGQEGLVPLVEELAGPSAQEFLDTLVDRVKSHAGGAFSDDVAVLVVRAGK